MFSPNLSTLIGRHGSTGRIAARHRSLDERSTEVKRRIPGHFAAHMTRATLQQGRASALCSCPSSAIRVLRLVAPVHRTSAVPENRGTPALFSRTSSAWAARPGGLPFLALEVSVGSSGLHQTFGRAVGEWNGAAVRSHRAAPRCMIIDVQIDVPGQWSVGLQAAFLDFKPHCGRHLPP